MAEQAGFEVFRDDRGIPHLRAGDAHALAHAQGLNAAVDRAWQIEIERHRVQGTTAAFLGAEGVGWDRFARQARLEDTARRCFARLEPETAAWVTSYVDGVNAGLAQGAGRAPEFAAVALTPGTWNPWTPLGVWLSTHILFAGFPTKLWREEVARRLGDEAVSLFATDGPGTAGSNGWLLAAERTRTGAPVIAGDPHRFIEAPGVYQQIRLACPEFDVVGLAVPGVPGIAHFGHTGGVAWAITNAMADYQDLYREQLRRTACGAGVEALGPDGWEPATAHTETIEVAGAETVEAEVIETRRGPVIIGGPDSDNEDVISLRYPPRVTGTLGFDALPALLRARTVADLDAALDRWVEPVNVVLAADTTGATLHRVAGYVPLRPDDNRLRVVPAHDPAYAWQGRYAPMPRVAIDGAAVMANARGIATPLGVEFAPVHRAHRIGELLDRGGDRWSAEDMAAIHTDTYLASARPLLDLLAAAPGVDLADPGTVRLRDRLLRWDRHMAADSTDATLYAELRTEVVRGLAAHPALAALTGPADPMRSTRHPAMFRPWLAAVPRIGYALEHLLAAELIPYEDRLAAVTQAAEAVAARYADGREPRPWSEEHRLAPWQALPDTQESRPGLAGDHDCVLSTSSVPGVTPLSARGPAARFVWDLARREDSLWVVPFGASGVPSDGHHRDQLPLWVRGELAPVTTDWKQLHTCVHKPSKNEKGRHMATRPADRTTVHEQKVEGLGTVRLVPIDPAADLDLIYSWVREERARFWGMTEFTREEVLEAYTFLDSLTTHHGYLALRDGVPVAVFQTYDPAADPLAECYDVQPGDFGVHFLLGPCDTPQPGYTAALLSVLTTYAFSDPAHLRVVVEPDARNEKAISRMAGIGFDLGPEVDKPEKRARLAFLSRPDGARSVSRTRL